tara:strand:- start:13799 stop:14902 length:1104 start_codon:yes stop_codon:yes gene_type:complete
LKVLVTGADGFIGKNLIFRLRELKICYNVFTRKNTYNDLEKLIKDIDFIFHLAGENRPKHEVDFSINNVELTSQICKQIKKTKRKITLLFSSSTQAILGNSYGKSKLAAEALIKKYAEETGNKAYIYRLPGVFGKWARNNYNSVVATFCYNVSHGLPIKINDPNYNLRIVYIDDVVDEFIGKLKNKKNSKNNLEVRPEYKITISALSSIIISFRNSRDSLLTETVGSGLKRKLYATYLSYLPVKTFDYKIPVHIDQRGVFSEILKTKNSGQFSFFTAKPGVTRGGHYHHSKTEKFLVVQGKAKFHFKNIVTMEEHNVYTNSNIPKIVETPPGWWHNITNIGKNEMIVVLWANEIFDKKSPDTFSLNY